MTTEQEENINKDIEQKITCMLFPYEMNPKRLDQNGKPTKTYYPFIIKNLKEENLDICRLKKHIEANRPTRAAVLSGGNSAKHFVRQQIFALDFDDGLISIKDTFARCKELGLKPNLWYESIRSSVDLIKFRIFFIITKPVFRADIAHHIRLALLELFPEADSNCTDAPRLYNGTTKNVNINERLNDRHEFLEIFKKIKLPQKTNSKVNSKSESNRINEAIINLTKNFNWNLAQERSKLIKAFFAGKDHTGSNAELKYTDLRILAYNLNLVEGGLSLMKKTMEQHNSNGLTKYNINDFNCLVEALNRNYTGHSFQYSNFIDDRKYKSIFEVVKYHFPKTLKHAESNKYIIDIISHDVFQKWDSGQSVFIEAGTGLGKTSFILGSEKDLIYDKLKIFDNLESYFEKVNSTTDSLAAYAKSKRKKILLLENRAIAKDQQKIEVEKFYYAKMDTSKTVLVLTYQYIEWHHNNFIKGLKGFEKDFELTQFDYIVFDEAHYFISDVSFSDSPPISWKLLNNLPNNPTRIYMTATADGIFELVRKNNPDVLHYDIGVKYNHVDKFIIFNNKSYIDDILKECKTNGKKAMVFNDNKLELLKHFLRYENQSRIIVAGKKDVNSLLSTAEVKQKIRDTDIGKLSFKKNQKTIEDIKANAILFVEESAIERMISDKKCDRQFLFATSKIDCGFNIIDDEITDIIVTSREPSKIIQWIGRYRAEHGSEHKIIVHIANVTSQYCAKEHEKLSKELKKLESSEDEHELLEICLNKQFNLLDNIRSKKYSWLDKMKNMLGNNVVSFDYELKKEVQEPKPDHIKQILESYENKKITGKSNTKQFYTEIGIKKPHGKTFITNYKEFNKVIRDYGYEIVQTKPKNRITICVRKLVS